MITQTHTIILTTSRFEIPSNTNVIEILNNLIHNNLLNIDYFGGELDNQADYLDEEMTNKIATTSFITLHFDQNTSDDIDYNSDEETILNLMASTLMENQIKEVLVDEKDIEIFIY
jgi:hypothetical protein